MPPHGRAGAAAGSALSPARTLVRAELMRVGAQTWRLSPERGPAVPGGEEFFGRVRVRSAMRDLQLETIQNIGEGNCFAWGVEDTSSRTILADIVRPSAREFISEHPQNILAFPVFLLRSRPRLMKMESELQTGKLKILRFASNVISCFWMFQLLQQLVW